MDGGRVMVRGEIEISVKPGCRAAVVMGLPSDRAEKTSLRRLLG